MSPPRRSVFITGASRGLGETIARELDRHGWTVYAGYRDPDDAARLSANGSPHLTPVALDVTDDASVEAAFARVRRETNGAGLDALVNNAGIAVGGPLEFLPIDQVRRQFDVNVFGVIAVTQAFLPLLRAAAGRIVNMGSVSGRVAFPFVGPYSASKFALEGLSDAWRVELARWGMRVVLIEPGAHRTGIWQTSLERALQTAERWPPRARELYGGVLRRVAERLGGVPQRASSPERVARVVRRALTARRPRARYPVGLDAWAGVTIAQILPTWLRDRVITR